MENDKIVNEGSDPNLNKENGDTVNENDKPIDNVLKLLIDRFKSNERLFRAFHSLTIVLITIIAVFFIIFTILYIVPVLKEIPSVKKPKISSIEELKTDKDYKKQIGLITRDLQRLSRKYNAYTSGQSYVVINTTDNRFFLYRNKKLIREGFCSSGSYKMLQTESDKKWIFKTPKGKYRIQGKTTNPVWKKPDWAFVEEGLPIPSKDDYSRYEYGVLGDYALAIGDGYLIHGTIYKRFLGMPVTHGCVRLNDEDLEVIFNTLSIGSKVYIF